MKTNIIHVLIIAIVLIAGWSLFTVLQDIYNDGSLKYDHYSVIGKSKQYLPIAPENYSNQRKSHVANHPEELNLPGNVSQTSRNRSTNDDYISLSEGVASIDYNQTPNFTKQSLGYSGKISASVSPGNSGMKKTYRNNDEGVAKKSGRGIKNQDIYNAVPAGEGLYLLFFMAILYTIGKMWKKNTLFS